MQTKDGWLTMLPYSGDNWCAFFKAVGRPELIEDLGVRDPVLRSQNIDKVYDRMSEIGPTRTTAQSEELLLRLDVPHTAFARLTEIAEQPHLAAVGLFADIDHPTEGRIRQARPATKFSESPAGIHRMAPRLGEHSREVLREAGMSEAEIQAVIDRKVVLPHRRHARANAQESSFVFPGLGRAFPPAAWCAGDRKSIEWTFNKTHA